MSENSKINNVEVRTVIIIESVIGDGRTESPLRSFRQFFDMDGNEIEAGDFTQ